MNSLCTTTAGDYGKTFCGMLVGTLAIHTQAMLETLKFDGFVNTLSGICFQVVTGAGCALVNISTGTTTTT
jgi:hypothetical protein